MDTTRFDDDLRAMLDEVESDRRGEPSDYLADVAGQHVDGLAVAVCTVDGHQTAVGETEHAFALQSVSKALTYAVVLQEVGLDHVLEHVGVEPSGESFNHLSLHDDGRPCNPLINAGAILVHALLPAGDEDERTALLLRRYSAMAGVELEVSNWRGLMTHPGIAPQALTDLIDVVRRTVESSQWRDILTKQGWDDEFLPGEQYGTFLAEEEKRVQTILDEIGLT